MRIKYILLSLAGLFLAGGAFADDLHAGEAGCKYYFFKGEPRGGSGYDVLFRGVYAISVDEKTKAVNWVSYCLDGKLAAAYENNPDGRSAPWLGESEAEAAPVASFGGAEAPRETDRLKEFWLRLDEQARAVALSGYVVHVVAGPLQGEADAVEGLWGVIAVPLGDEGIRTVGYIFDRESPAGRQLTVDEIEEKTGLDFMPNLTDDIEEWTEKAISIRVEG